MYNLIGICGYARHGKDTIANLLVNEFGYQRKSWADKLRELALAIDPLVKVEGMLDPQRLTDLVDEYGWDLAKKNYDVRRLLQRIGTEGGRTIFGDNVWVDLLLNSVGSDDKVVIPDTRFPNEAKALLDRGGIIIRIVRPDFDNGIGTDHPSEYHVPNLPATFQVSNDGTIEDLYTKVRPILKELVSSCPQQ